MKPDIVISAPVRTAIGSFGGTLKDIPAADLGSHVIVATLERSGIDRARIDSVLMGNVIQAGSGMNTARQASVNAGLSVDIPAMALNRVCGSGAQAIISAYAEIVSGQAQVVVAGGMENMDRAPYTLPGMRFGARLGHAEAIDTLLSDGLNDAFSGKHSGWHTEDLASEYRIDRAAQDDFAARSQQRFAAAQEAGRFQHEIAPIEIKTRKGSVSFGADESGRPDTTPASLAKLKPAFRPDGSITAGNAPGLSAGAAAMIVSERTLADRMKLQPLLVVRGMAVVGVEPAMFGLGPIPAIRKVLERAGWRADQVDRFEVNEAFAAIALAVQRTLDLDPARFNVDGGAIAHGHPIGATGAILVTKVAHALARTGERRAVVSLCIGGGQGIALALERI